MTSSTSSDSTASAAQRLLGAWQKLGSRPALVVTGAGISHASGISTFRGRDPQAIWNVSDVEIATVDYFRRDPVGHWQWYLERFRRIDRAEPNPGHHALAKLERWHRRRGGELTLVTQNIDTLHELAGSQRLIKIHGSSDRVRCAETGCGNGAPRGSLARQEADFESFFAEPSPATLPCCPRCSAPLRPHVLFFDEYYQEHEDYRFDEAIEAAARAELVLFIGTSFSVGITDLVTRSALGRGVPLFSIDPNPSPQARAYGVVALAEPAENVLPAIVARLAADRDDGRNHEQPT